MPTAGPEIPNFEFRIFYGSQKKNLPKPRLREQLCTVSSELVLEVIELTCIYHVSALILDCCDKNLSFADLDINIC